MSGPEPVRNDARSCNRASGSFEGKGNIAFVVGGTVRKDALLDKRPLRPSTRPSKRGLVAQGLCATLRFYTTAAEALANNKSDIDEWPGACAQQCAFTQQLPGPLRTTKAT